jgi:hypothetical protein
MADRRLFQVVSAAADASARRLVTAEYVGAMMADPPADAVLEAYIDEVSAVMAEEAGLASDGVHEPTFAEEDLRATWFASTCVRSDRLELPWRLPITDLTVTEAGAALTAGTDYQLLPGGVLLRLSDDTPIAWSSDKIVVDYTAGWYLPEDAPTRLGTACAEQVKYRAMAFDRDPAVRSESTPDVYSASYAVPGGDTVAKNGLLLQVDSALDQYRPPRSV